MKNEALSAIDIQRRHASHIDSTARQQQRHGQGSKRGNDQKDGDQAVPLLLLLPLPLRRRAMLEWELERCAGIGQLGL